MKSARPRTNPIYEVASANREKLCTSGEKSGLLDCRAPRGSAALPDEADPSIVASHDRNMISGTTVPKTTAVRTFWMSPSKSDATTGTMLW